MPSTSDVLIVSAVCTETQRNSQYNWDIGLQMFNIVYRNTNIQWILLERIGVKHDTIVYYGKSKKIFAVIFITS